MDLSIKGADDLGDLAKRLRAAGDSGKGLKRELYRGLNRATKPLKAEAKKVGAERLPQSGGLAAKIAKQSFRTAIRTGKNPGVSIVASKKGGGAAFTSDRHGYVKHPVFGNRETWVRQDVGAKGWFTETLRAGAPTVRKELTEAIENVADQIKKG